MQEKIQQIIDEAVEHNIIDSEVFKTFKYYENNGKIAIYNSNAAMLVLTIQELNQYSIFIFEDDIRKLSYDLDLGLDYTEIWETDHVAVLEFLKYVLAIRYPHGISSKSALLVFNLTD